MKRPSKTTSTIKGKEWLKCKPYTQFRPYDQKYVKIASDIHTALLQHKDFLNDVFENDEQAFTDLAVILASYLEDMVNEIGIWKVFVEQNQELYGYPLPFMSTEDLADYEPGEINQPDVAYLIWHFLNTDKNSYFAPDSDIIANIVADTWDVIEAAWDDAPVTDFYDEYLTIAEDINFFNFKDKLSWFGIKAYPLYLEATLKNQTSLENLVKGENGPQNMDQISRFFYMIVDEYIMRDYSHYNAMQAIDWFAKVIRSSEDFKTSCLSIKDNLWGTFELIESTETHHLFQYQDSDRTFSIRKDSMTSEVIPSTEQIFVMRIVPFQNDWYLSGMSSIFEKELQGDQFRNPNPAPFQVYSSEQQAKMLMRTEKMEADFQQFFGSLFQLTRDHEDLIKKATDYTQFQYNNQKNDNPDLADFNYAEHANNNRKLMPEAPGTALAFVPNQGLMFEAGIDEWLEQIGIISKLTREESGHLLFHLAAEVYPENLQYIMENYQPDGPLLFPVEFSEIDFWPYLPFFSRYCQPENYGRRWPMVAEV
jgi:hypothetical protein